MDCTQPKLVVHSVDVKRTASFDTTECHIRGADGPDQIEPRAIICPRLSFHERHPKVINNALR